MPIYGKTLYKSSFQEPLGRFLVKLYIFMKHKRHKPFIICTSYDPMEAPWPTGRAWDSGARSRGSDPQLGCHVVSLSKIIYLPKCIGNTQEELAPSRQN